MDEMYRELFSTFHQFQRLKIGDMFPELTKGECMTLMAIEHSNKNREHGIITVSELAVKLEAQTSAVSRTLKSLEDKEYIVRTIHKSDRRNTYVELTERGRNMLSEAENTMCDFAKAVITQMDEEDLRRLTAYLNELYRVARKEIEKRKKNKMEKETE